MTALGEFLKKAGCKVKRPGVWDCCGFPAAWAMERGRSDPMAAWRGQYDTEAGAQALIAEAGDLHALFAEGMDAAGIPTVDGPPQAGDMAVVRFMDEQLGAIFTGERWALVADRGLAFSRLPERDIVQVWRP